MSDPMLSLVSTLASSSMSQGQISHHAALIESVQGSAPPINVPTATLQALAKASASPTQFVRQYSSCSSQQVKQLPGMMQLLAEIVNNDDIKTALNEEAEAPNNPPVNFNSPDLKTLRERLLKEVVSSTNAQVVLEKQKPKTLFDSRPALTANFLLGGDAMKTRDSLSCLKGVPTMSQESLLLKELLYCLLGNGGQHIVPAQGTAGVAFTLDKDMDQSLQALITRLLPLATNYSKVVSWCEETDRADGLVNQALSSALELLLHDYRMLVCQLEQSLAKNNLTLHQLHHQLQSSKHCMEILSQLVEDIHTRQATGGATLSILHSKLVHCGSDPKSEKIVKFLTELAAKPFFETLSKWLYRGVIIDPGKDFFVEDHEVVDRTCLPTEYNDDYWEKRYCLRMDKVPAFLSRYADTILRTGKYLNVIQQCDKTARWPDIIPLQYLHNPEHYQPVLLKAHQFASTTLLQLLLNDRDLIGHLKSVKKYFLMEQGDFINQFLDICESELSQPVDCVEPARLESLLEMAARTSTANFDQYKDNLCVALLPYDLEFQVILFLRLS